MKKTIVTLCLSLFCIHFIYAQSYELGLNPSRLKWYQIKTDQVQVIFPQGLDQQAQRVANLIQYLADSTKLAVGQKSNRVSILLQNQTTIPNGFVSVSPFRSEFFMTPPQFNFAGSANWMDLLTIHEYRHVLQNQNARVGITKLASIAFGQNGWGFMSGMALPRWYMEGDAVLAETSFTQSGRGQTPDFDKEYRSLILDKRNYNYEKASAGSYKDFVPSHYQLGYNMVTYARNNFGQDIWAKVVNGAGKYKGIFYPFSHTLKKETGLGTKQLYQKTMESLDKMYQSDLEGLALTSSKQVNTKEKKKYTDYRNPQFLDDNRLVVEKSSFEEIRNYYIIDNLGNETRLYAAGFNVETNANLSVKNGTLAWAEITYHPRWFNKNYSIIRIGQAIPGGKRQKVTARTKLFSPDLANNGSNLVAVKAPDDLNYSLVILNKNTGEIVKELPNPENYFFAFPRWTDDDKALVVVIRKDNLNALAKVMVESGDIQLITNWTNEQLANPYPSGDYVFFAGSFTGINNIFAVKQGDKTIYQVTSTRLGAFQPAVSPNGKTLAFSEFTSMGYDLKTMEVKPNEWKKITASTPSLLTFYKTSKEQDGGSILEKLPAEEHEVKRFRKINGVFQLHSWNPIVSDPFDPEGGIEIEVDNKISTLSARGGYIYNANEESGRFYGELAYGEFWPIFRIGYTGKNERDIFYPTLYGTTSNASDTSYWAGYIKTWDESTLNFGVTLPFNLTRRNFFANLEVSADYERIKLEYQSPLVFIGEGDDEFVDFTPSNFQTDETIGAMDIDVELRGNKITAVQNLYPKFGYLLNIRHRRVVGNSSLGQGSTTLLRGRLFTPGFFKNHGILFLAQYQWGSRFDTYTFRNQFASSRGYATFDNDGASRFTVNYTFPIVYPDLAIGSLAFLQRIKGTIFYDQATYSRDGYRTAVGGVPVGVSASEITLRSAGIELTTDFRAFRLLDIDLGVRYSYLYDYQTGRESSPHSFEFLLVRINP